MKNLNTLLNDGWTRLDTDVLILGSGLAGLLLSILLHDRGAAVTVASKETFSDSNTFYAQGGLAAVTSARTADRQNGRTADPSNGLSAITSNAFLDSLVEHLSDTIKSGAGLTDPHVARELIDGAPQLVQELTRLGMFFDRDASGEYALAREGGHSKARVLHSKDTTGKAISNALVANATDKSLNSTNYNLIQYCFAFNLLSNGQRIAGAEVLHDGVVKRIYAKHVVLATGGAGQIFSRTTNPLVATADGAALAYRAGATLADLEFVQFHPTALALPGAPAFLISEAVRGAGAVLLDGDLKPFVKNFHPDGDLATRDVVARAIHQTMMSNDLPSVNLDLRPIGKQTLVDRFPNIVETCRRFGVNPTEEPIPVCPAAHYFMGGILTDACGHTSLPNLYAIGEVASTGLHGANRLASNSLLEAGVMAIKLANLLDTTATAQQPNAPKELGVSGVPSGNFRENFSVPSSIASFKSNMYEYASLTRSEPQLRKLSGLLQSDCLPSTSFSVANVCAANILLMGELIATAAINRKESRGSHFREDFPQVNDHLFARRQVVSAGRWQWIPVDSNFAKIDKQSHLTA
ncbi:MAG: FAD-binding protein [Cyanobacteria bacterium SZAS-4]|nr:FAD-binding protein [Cyanobacteria bacterium SZAS-4]